MLQFTQVSVAITNTENKHAYPVCLTEIMILMIGFSGQRWSKSESTLAVLSAKIFTYNLV